ncbi:hypothetical protein Tco_1139795 [Tanacetum coccineum]
MSEFWYTTKTLEDSKVWVSTPTGGVKGDIGGKTGGLDQISNKDATILYCLANVVQVDYAKLIWEDLINKRNKKTREKIIPYLRFIFLLLEHMIPKYNNEELTINPTQVFSVYICTLNPNQPKEPLFTTHIKAICKLDVHAVSKAPKPSLQTDEVPKGKKHGAKTGLIRKQSLKHTSEYQTEASKSKTGQSEIETKSSSTKDKSPSHPLPPTPVDMDEGTKNYSIDHIFAGSNPSVLLKDLLEFLKDTRSAFFTPNSPQDDPIIVTDESEEEEADKEDTHDTSHDVPEDTSKDELEQQKATAEAEVASLKARSSYPDVNQLTTLLVTFLKPELSKLLASHNFANCLPTNLKELPSKFTELSREIKEIKQHVKDMEIKLPRDLKEIPTKLETFTSTISSLTSQVAELKNIQWELPTELQALPILVSLV